MKFAILGSGSCFGTNLADHLLKNGHEVIGIGRSPKKPECFSLGVDYPYHAYHITYELDYVMKVLDQFKPQIIVNFAAQGEGAASFNPEDSWRFYETNAVGLVRLAGQLASRTYLERFINVGTSEFYGSVTQPSVETDPINPTSPYGVSKSAFDLHLIVTHRVNAFPMNILRPTNGYCPGQQLHRIIPKALIYGLTRKILPLHGGGKSEKSYLHATDVSKAVLLVAEKAPIGEVYNVAPDMPTSILEVVERCAKVLQMPFEKLCKVSGERLGQDSRYWLNSGKIKALGWEQTIFWDEGLEDMLNWVLDYPELLKMPTEFTMRA